MRNADQRLGSTTNSVSGNNVTDWAHFLPGPICGGWEFVCTLHVSSICENTCPIKTAYIYIYIYVI